MAFIQENSLLILLAIASGGMLYWPWLRLRGAAGTWVDAHAAVLLINRNKPLILDVRTHEQYAGGHIAGARHVPLAELANAVPSLVKYQSKPILVVCQRGRASLKAIRLLRQQQFTQLYQITDGIEGWHQAHLPLVKSDSPVTLPQR